MTPRLIAVTPGDHGAGRDLRDWFPALGRAGLPAVLIREPQARAPELAAEAARWIPTVILHDRMAGARDLGFPLHLSSAWTRGVPEGTFGVSCHGAAEVDRAFAAGATWAFLSPVWSPGSKPGDPRPTLGPERFLQIAAGRPVLALGGVDAPRLRGLREEGAYGGAVMGAIFGAGTPDEGADRVRELLAACRLG